jgi:cell division septation protein DedD
MDAQTDAVMAPVDAQTDAVMAPAKPKRTRAGRPEKTKPTKTDPQKAESRQKITLVVSDSVDFRLGALASLLKLDRSTLAAKLLDQGMKAYAVDAVFRGVFVNPDDRQETAA